MIKDVTVACPLLYTMMDQCYDLIDGIPDVWIMSKRSRSQLKTSLLGLAGLSVALDRVGNPIETYAGVPIIVSDAVINTEVNT
jgi:hypothetical protein